MRRLSILISFLAGFVFFQVFSFADSATYQSCVQELIDSGNGDRAASSCAYLSKSPELKFQKAQDFDDYQKLIESGNANMNWVDKCGESYDCYNSQATARRPAPVQITPTDTKKAEPERDAQNQPTPAQSKASTQSGPNEDSKDQKTASPSTPTGTPSSAPESSPATAQNQTDPGIKNQADEDLKACRDQQARTKRCCLNPVACMTTGGVQDAFNMLSGLAAAGGAVMIGTAGNDPKKLQQACSIMQGLGYGSGATNAGLAAVCYTEISSCEDKCDAVKNKYKNMISDVCPGGSSSCAIKSHLSSVSSEASSASYSCQSMNGQVQSMATQAVAGGLSGSFGGLCANLSNANTGFPNLDKQPIFNTDCNNPLNASNPACLNCALAANKTNPLCNQAGSRGLGDGSGVAMTGSPNFGMGSANQNNVAANAGFDGNGQKDVTGGGQFKPSSSGGVPNAPGQMLGSGSSGNFGSPDRPQGGRGAGYNTDVLQGTGGGGGYTVSSAPVAGGGGGFGGYGQQGTDPKTGKPFDLRNYLPGGSKDPKRAIAGLGGIRPEFGNKFDDIFKRINDRYTVLCKLGRMLECGKK